MARVLIVDCFDSFTHNIAHYLKVIDGVDVSVVRYDALNITSVNGFSHIVLSPGPGLPALYPKIGEILDKIQGSKSVLGVCLGLQYLVVHAGGGLERLSAVKHGITSGLIVEQQRVLFKNLSGALRVGHYHSWVASAEQFPHAAYLISSRNDEGNIMSIEHKFFPYFGVQFHPESVLTPWGQSIFENWLEATKLS